MPSSRQDLINHALRDLGAPVLQINVDSDQVQDCVDDTIQLYQEYHQDAVHNGYFKYQLTDSDETNGYFEVPDDITYVDRMFPISSSTGSGMFSIQYQMMLNDVTDLNRWSGDISYYYQLEQYLDTLDIVLNGQPQITFARKQNRVYIWGEFESNDVHAGDWVMLEVTQIIDPDTHTKVYNDIWVKQYLAALIKKQWGQNLSKFEGMQLPGGVQFSGREIKAEAIEELRELKQELRDVYEKPIDMLIG